MSFEQLWAPWRLTYIKQEGEAARPAKRLELPPGAEESCFICRGLADDDDRANLIVERGTRTVTILNRYPYNNGHLLVAPQAHRGELAELDAADHLKSIETIARMIDLLRRTMNPEGFNVGLNLGRVAGAGLPGHLHWHIVPRWNGDTNFMPVLAGVNVIPQSLEALWTLLTDALSADRTTGPI